jgi:hypothetical protein
MSISRGRPLVAGLLVTLVSALATAVAAPAQAATAAEPLPPLPMYLPSDSGYYHDAGATQFTASDGGFALLTVAQPYVAPKESHSLAAIAARSTDGLDNVQVGWSVDPARNGDDQPRLFVFHRSNGTDTCYDGCGFEPYAPSTVHVGDVLPGGPEKFGVEHSGERWWVAYGAQWIGSFPDALWSRGFTRTGAVEYFGEVAAATAGPSCSWMGTGAVAESVPAARFGSITLINGANSTLEVGPVDDVYDVRQISATSIRFGGPGAC